MASKDKTPAESTSPQKEQVPVSSSTRVTRSKDSETKDNPKEKSSPPGDAVTASSAAKRITRSQESEAKETRKEKSSSTTGSASSSISPVTAGSAAKRTTRSQESEAKESPKEKSSTASPSISPVSAGKATKRITGSQEDGAKEDPKEKSPPTSANVPPPGESVSPSKATKRLTRSKVSESDEDPKEKLTTTVSVPPPVEPVTTGAASNRVIRSQESNTRKKNPLPTTTSSSLPLDRAMSGKQDNLKRKLSPVKVESSQEEDDFTAADQGDIEIDDIVFGDSSEKPDDGEKSPTEEQIFECKFCSEFFILSSLKQHIENKHTHVETEVCPTCGYCEVKGGPMKDHPSCFVCWTCSIFFTSKASLKEHMLLHDIPDDNEDWHVCESCQARFCTYNALTIHYKCHEVQVLRRAKRVKKIKAKTGSKSGDESDEEVPIKQCRSCAKFFKSAKSLHRHVKKIHTKVKTKICDRCGFFQRAGGPVGKHLCETEKEKLIKEIKVKKAIKKEDGGRYACKLCPKSYAFHQGLRAHMNTHKPNSEKPYHCDVCDKPFAKKILYEDHMRIHSGEKPFLCHICAKFFRSGANLRQHQRRCKKKGPDPYIPQSPRSSNRIPQKGPTLLHQQIVEEEGQVIFEVQMEIMDGHSDTVVIDLGAVEQSYAEAQKKRLESNAVFDITGMMVESVDEKSKVTSDTKYSTEEAISVDEKSKATSDTKNSTEDEAKQDDDDQGSVVPVAIHANKPDQTEDEVSSGKPDEDAPAEFPDISDDDNDDDIGDADDTRDSDHSIPPPVDLDDHDYIKETHSVLEEQKVEKEQKVKKNMPQKLLDIYFMCPYCKGLLDSKLSTKRHIKSKHKKAKKFDGIVVLGHSEKEAKNITGGEDTIPVDWAYQCSHCNAFYSEQEIEAHLESVEIKRGVCKVCLRTHKKGAKSNDNCKLSRARKAFQCPYCNIKPVTLCDLRGHLPMKHGDNQYPCTLCDATFENKRGLSCHLQKHRRENEPKGPKGEPGPKKQKKYICEICSKIMTDRASFRIHRMHHENPKPFACKLCPKAYTFPNGLRVHMRTHTKNFPFLCEYCSRTFKTKACLICHIRCHTGEKPFDCVRCGKIFRTKANMRQHLKRCHVTTRQVTTSAETELEIATEIVTAQPETYLFVVQKQDQQYSVNINTSH